MKILLVGRSGNLGSYIYMNSIHKDNFFSISRRKINDEKNISYLDLNDIKNVQDFSNNSPHFDCLVFLAALAHKKGANKEFNDFYKANYQTLKNLLSSLQKKSKLPKKIIFASTISVYGEKYDVDIYKEGDKINPYSPYAITKYQAEKYLIENFEKHSWILRIAPIYSPNFNLNLIRRTKIKNFNFRVGDGNMKLSLCNINNIVDVVDGIISNNIPPDIYNISDNCNYTYNDILNHRKVKYDISIPFFLVRILYLYGKITKNNFFKENSIKLISNNLFISTKINNFIKIKHTLNGSFKNIY